MLGPNGTGVRSKPDTHSWPASRAAETFVVLGADDHRRNSAGTKSGRLDADNAPSPPEPPEPPLPPAAPEPPAPRPPPSPAGEQGAGPAVKPKCPGWS